MMGVFCFYFDDLFLGDYEGQWHPQFFLQRIRGVQYVKG